MAQFTNDRRAVYSVRRHLRSICIFLALCGQSSALCADDWPQWRGPFRDGIWRETSLIQQFDRDEIEIKWRANIAGGYGGPTVADGHVYVTDRFVSETKQVERVHCFDADTGEAAWNHDYDCPYEGVSFDAGPRASITIHDGRAYSLGSMGHLRCFEARKGTVLWQKDLHDEYKIRMPIWGISCSPLIEGDFVILQISGSDDACIVAFDRTTGEERWRALDDPASYSSPIIVEQAGQRVLVCWTGDRVVGLNPHDGSLYWHCPTPPKRWVRGCASPVWNGDRLLISGFFSGTLMLKLRQDRLDVEELWRRVGPNEKETDGIHTNFAEPVILGDYVYGVDSYGELRCLDANTGDRVWENLKVIPQQRWSTLRLIPNRGHVWLFTELGELIISRLSPTGYEEIDRAKLIEPTHLQLPSRRAGVCWSYPAFAGRHVYARNDKELVCASLQQPE